MNLVQQIDVDLDAALRRQFVLNRHVRDWRGRATRFLTGIGIEDDGSRRAVDRELPPRMGDGGEVGDLAHHWNTERPRRGWRHGFAVRPVRQ